MRASLLRYAGSRLRNATLAEDAVSETLLAALQVQQPFPSRAQAIAWVYGILRHKLVDQLRHHGREIPAGDELPESNTRSLDWYVGGAWCGVTGVQAEPEQACSQRQFMTLLLNCCERLPAAQRQAFVQRELRCDEPAEICRRLGITEGHLWVLVHRARVRLRVLLSEAWLLPHEARQPRRADKSRRGRPAKGLPPHAGTGGPVGHRPAPRSARSGLGPAGG